MIDTLITSKTRIKLLLKFFLNPGNSAHLRGLETEFGESSNAIRLELNKLEKAKMLDAEVVGNRKVFKVNSHHPLYNEINSIVRKYFGLDIIVEKIAAKLGKLDLVYLTGDIVKGMDTDVIDLILVGEIDLIYLTDLIRKAEKLVQRKIRYLNYTQDEFSSKKISGKLEFLLIWKSDDFDKNEKSGFEKT